LTVVTFICIPQIVDKIDPQAAEPSLSDTFTTISSTVSDRGSDDGASNSSTKKDDAQYQRSTVSSTVTSPQSDQLQIFTSRKRVLAITDRESENDSDMHRKKKVMKSD
jgi:hypothetical protein